MKNLLFLGGDARYIEAIQSLSKEGYKITVACLGKVHFADSDIRVINFHQLDFSLYDVIILPVHGLTKEGYITSAFSDEKYLLTKDHIKQTAKHVLILSGIANDYLHDICENRTLKRLFSQPQLGLANAIPTAEGVLQIALTETNATIFNANVLVLGFGKIGFAVASLFQKVGANLTVAVRRDIELTRIETFKMHAISLNAILQEVPKYSIIINTIPSPTIDRAFLNKTIPSALIIDVASAPGGTDFSYAEKIGIQAVHALGLPGRFSPKTAGSLIAKAIKVELKKT